MKTPAIWRAPLNPRGAWGTPEVTGLFVGVPEDIYHSSPGISGTDCKKIARAPAYYAAAKAEKSDGDGKVSAALNFGKLAHAILLEDLEGAEFGQRFAVKPDDHNGRTTEGKKWVADNAHKTIVSAEDIEAANAMCAAADKHPDAKRLLALPGLVELSAVAVHPEYGIRLRGRFDKCLDAGSVLVDYKTAADASPDGFAKATHEFGYLLQAAHYLFLCGLLGLEEVKTFAWIVQEKEAPFATAVYTFGPGHEKWDEVQYALDLIYRRAARILKSGDFSETGMPAEAVKVTLPPWAKTVAAGINLEGEDA